MRPKLDIQCTVVLDTNALIDVYSCHDLDTTWTKLGAGASVDDPALVFRRARSREAALLAIMLHQTKAVSYSLHEGIRMIRKLVPPPESGTFPSHFTTMFLHFVKDQVLPDWTSGVPYEDDQFTGNSADDEYIRFAKAEGLTLISEEGFTARGIEPTKNKIPDKARKAGVLVQTAGDYYRAANRDENADIGWFLTKFREKAPDYVRLAPNAVGIENALGWMYGVYEHVLTGATEGQDQPATLRV